MRHATAVRRLRIIADTCTRCQLLPGGGGLLAAYTFGPVLEHTEDIPVVQVAFVLDHPAAELTWGAEPPECIALAHFLELHKAPVEYYWRPAVWPVANHHIRRPLCIWDTTGPAAGALDALAAGDAEPLRLPTPDPAEEQAQLAVERAACLTHLREVAQRYWDDRWRRAHRGNGIFPEHHLWDAVHGYLDLLDHSRIPAKHG